MMPIHPETFVAYTLAVFFGFGFGFVLERAGFGNARTLAAQFYLSDMRVLKVMFSAIVTAAIGLSLSRAFGILDFDQVYVNPTHLGAQVAGGLVFGVGFVVGGHCPGTAIVSAVTGRLNGLVFLVGVGAGSLGYAAIHPAIEGFASAGGERLLLTDLLPFSYGVVTLLVALLALVFFAGGERVEGWMARRAGRTLDRAFVRQQRVLLAAASGLLVLLTFLGSGVVEPEALLVQRSPERVSVFAAARALARLAPDTVVLVFDDGRHPLDGALPASLFGHTDDERVERMPRSRKLVLAGADEIAIDRLARRLADRGTTVSVLAGGIDAWDRTMDADPPEPDASADVTSWAEYRERLALRRRFGDSSAAPARAKAPQAVPSFTTPLASKKREGC